MHASYTKSNRLIGGAQACALLTSIKHYSRGAGVSAAALEPSIKAGGDATAAPAPAAGSSADAEMTAVRNRALASAKLPAVTRQTPTDPAAQGSPAAPHPTTAGVTPVLRLRNPATQQVSCLIHA